MVATPRRYETIAVLILCLSYGVVNFEMFSINLLMPFIQPNLELNNIEIGIVLAGFWVAFSVSSFLTGALADRAGHRKRLLVAVLLAFSLASILSGFATSFLTLLGARFIMGLLEGPVLPLAQSLVALVSSPQRRGTNMGIVQILGASVLGAFIAPLLLVRVASSYNWRLGFELVGLPGLLCALLVALYVHGADTHVAKSANAEVQITSTSVLLDVFKCRNVWLSAIISSFAIAYVTVAASFIPLFLLQCRSISSQTMSMMMSLLGIAGLIYGVMLPALSDRIGRKSIGILTAFLGALCPLAAAYFVGPTPALACLMFLGWALPGGATLFLVIIPSESVSEAALSTAIGFVIGVSTIVGGVGGPMLAGWSADRFGLQSTMQITAICALAAGTGALFLRGRGQKLVPVVG